MAGMVQQLLPKLSNVVYVMVGETQEGQCVEIVIPYPPPFFFFIFPTSLYAVETFTITLFATPASPNSMRQDPGQITLPSSRWLTSPLPNLVFVPPSSPSTTHAPHGHPIH